MKLYCLQYHGKSWQSWLIKAFTWSKDSHTAVAQENGLTLEAWQKCGVDLALHPWENHTPGTLITVYRLDATPEQCRKIWDEGLALEGEGYDWLSLAGFLPVLRWFWCDVLGKWFCSHYFAHICKKGGAPLFSAATPLYKLPPAVIPWSSRLEPIGEVSNLEEFDETVNNAG